MIAAHRHSPPTNGGGCGDALIRSGHSARPHIASVWPRWRAPVQLTESESAPAVNSSPPQYRSSRANAVARAESRSFRAHRCVFKSNRTACSPLPATASDKALAPKTSRAAALAPAFSSSFNTVVWLARAAKCSGVTTVSGARLWIGARLKQGGHTVGISCAGGFVKRRATGQISQLMTRPGIQQNRHALMMAQARRVMQS